MVLIRWLCSATRPHVRRLGERPGMLLQMTGGGGGGGGLHNRPVSAVEKLQHTHAGRARPEEPGATEKLLGGCDRTADRVCRLSSCAHVEKGGGLEKESLSPNQTQRNGGYLVSSLKR